VQQGQREFYRGTARLVNRPESCVDSTVLLSRIDPNAYSKAL
jgi:hypothetical protein